MKHLGNWNATQSQYSFGNFTQKKKIETSTTINNSIPYIYTQKSTSNFNIVTKATMHWDANRQEAIEKGNLIHIALSKISIKSDIEDAISSLLENGDIILEDIPFLENKLKQIIDHPKLTPYFKDNLTIYNEKELLTPEGKLFIPDRLIIEDNSLTIIDYKTGTKNDQHKLQLQKYAKVLEEMNYKIKNMILIYINETITPIFI